MLYGLIKKSIPVVHSTEKTNQLSHTNFSDVCRNLNQRQIAVQHGTLNQWFPTGGSLSKSGSHVHSEWTTSDKFEEKKKYNEFLAQSLYFEVLLPAVEWVTNGKLYDRDSKLDQ